jgi:3-phytase
VDRTRRLVERLHASTTLILRASLAGLVLLAGSPEAPAATIPLVCGTATGDGAADDPAIWINRHDPAESLVLVAYKGGDLKAFNPSRNCAVVKVISGLSRPNNVDVEYDLDLGGQRIDIAVMTERNANRLRIYKLQSRPLDLVLVGLVRTVLPEPMGVALYRDPETGAIDAFVSPKSPVSSGAGTIQIYRLVEGNLSNADASDDVQGVLLGRFGSFDSEVEGLSVDDEKGLLYASHERLAIKVFTTEGLATGQSFGGSGEFSADREGSAVFTCGLNRYVIVSNQGSNSFRVYNARTGYSFVGEFQAQSTSQTDGLEVTTSKSIPGFPSGLFAAQNNDKNVNLYHFRDVALALRLDDCLGSTPPDTVPPAPPLNLRVK